MRKGHRVTCNHMRAWGFKIKRKSSNTAFVAKSKYSCDRCKVLRIPCIINKLIVVKPGGVFRREQCHGCAKEDVWCDLGDKTYRDFVIGEGLNIYSGARRLENYNCVTRKIKEVAARREARAAKRMAKEEPKLVKQGAEKDATETAQKTAAHDGTKIMSAQIATSLDAFGANLSTLTSRIEAHKTTVDGLRIQLEVSRKAQERAQAGHDFVAQEQQRQILELCEKLMILKTAVDALKSQLAAMAGSKHVGIGFDIENETPNGAAVLRIFEEGMTNMAEKVHQLGTTMHKTPESVPSSSNTTLHHKKTGPRAFTSFKLEQLRREAEQAPANPSCGESPPSASTVSQTTLKGYKRKIEELDEADHDYNSTGKKDLEYPEVSQPTSLVFTRSPTGSSGTRNKIFDGPSQFRFNFEQVDLEGGSSESKLVAESHDNSIDCIEGSPPSSEKSNENGENGGDDLDESSDNEDDHDGDAFIFDSAPSSSSDHEEQLMEDEANNASVTSLASRTFATRDQIMAEPDSSAQGSQPSNLTVTPDVPVSNEEGPVNKRPFPEVDIEVGGGLATVPGRASAPAPASFFHARP